METTNAYWQINKMWYTYYKYIKIYISYPYNRLPLSKKKEWNTDIYYNMDKPLKHYVKCKMLNERPYITWLYSYEMCKIRKSIETRSR